MPENQVKADQHRLVIYPATVLNVVNWKNLDSLDDATSNPGRRVLQGSVAVLPLPFTHPGVHNGPPVPFESTKRQGETSYNLSLTPFFILP
ncbi:unnamed protein product [Strongylus vulgaris]|uniref:Uncharacterized protein n=1 Tax=Strongylus vulgaris TaxID=40348 RepID=A0A3P7IX63_STRVU|nr:unnamed protein product [Strongylus vulgaris]